MASRAPPLYSIVCFGEALWDVLPRGIFLGGAPLNVAYHLSRLGVPVVPISAVGRDFLGDEVIRRVADWGIDTRLIVRRRREPTGTVHATVDGRGIPRFQITEHVAWDRLTIPRGLRSLTEPGALVFGSLALRGESNRRALSELVARWPGALRVLDLNLRTPFDRGRGPAFALKQAQFVKLNDAELASMSGESVRTTRRIEAAARHFAAAHELARICVTAGARGAGLLWDECWYWEDSRPVMVRDTIGSGDAFLAAFLAARFARVESPADALASACRLGEFVATQDGATPPYRVDPHGRPVAETQRPGGRATRTFDETD